MLSEKICLIKFLRLLDNELLDIVNKCEMSEEGVKIYP